MSHPRGIDRENLRGTFGCAEFEDLAKDILAFLADDKRKSSIPLWLKSENGRGWRKSFYMSDVTSDGVLFAMFCCAGWITHIWLPKGAFTVSDAFVERVIAKKGAIAKAGRPR